MGCALSSLNEDRGRPDEKQQAVWIYLGQLGIVLKGGKKKEKARCHNPHMAPGPQRP